ncbi:DNA-directed RNA polymerase [Dimargaris cristalligena]|uniref:DNA-directed RNA polymerase n=1 Tax=Dimargaris cristalligena TaxID=215637 RepID=A0A4P9ZR34_9FUNG|nr:DNA-directed RNA polymerase [Dimargaris cristalligena]|eukprot:RKP35966.1 DNA-directed RNA polymerase [Dimargaris cristalligena]
MNAPDFYEMFTLPEGVKKVAVHRDAKQLDTATIEIQKEDHTLGNLISKKLLKDNRVTFSGYKFPHPLEHKILIRVQTTEEITPVVAVHDAIGGLISELQDIAGKFKVRLISSPMSILETTTRTLPIMHGGVFLYKLVTGENQINIFCLLT